MKKTLLLFSALSLVATLAACSVKLPPNTDDQPLTGSCIQKDGACCLGSNCASVIADCSVGAKPVFKGCSEECIPNFECVADTEDVVSALKQLFATKYNKDISQITVNIAKQTDQLVRGGVMIGEPGPGAGGNFFAAKVDGNWQLVFAGNGGFSCEFLRSYGFPEDMIKDCDGTMSAQQHARLYGVLPAQQSTLKTFQDNELGIEFQYPKEWPQPVVSPGVYTGGFPQQTSKWRLDIGIIGKGPCEGDDCAQYTLEELSYLEYSKTLQRLRKDDMISEIKERVANGQKVITYSEGGLSEYDKALIFGAGKTMQFTNVWGSADSFKLLIDSFKFINK